MRPYSPGGVLKGLPTARRGSIPPIPSTHRLRRGLPGYLIRFAPHAFAPQRQERPRRPPSPLVFLPISTHITAPPGIPPPPASLKPDNLPRPPPFGGGLSQGIHRATYTPFTPSKSGQRSPPTFYRDCWHVVGRGLFARYRPCSSPTKGVYNPKAVIPHAALLGQAFAHCPISLAAASRRSRGCVSVPVWLAILSDQLPVTGLVGLYLTNYLIGRRPLPRHPKAFLPSLQTRELRGD